MDGNVEISAYSCRNCGTVFYHYEGNNCLFCNNVLIEKKDITMENEKIFIVPYQKSLEEAKKNYRKKVLWNPFVPLFFKKRKNIDNMKKIYIPCYFLNVNVTGSPVFLGMDKNSIVKDKKKMIESKKYELSYNTNFDYNGLVVSKFSKIALLFETVCKDGSSQITELNADAIGDVPVFYEDLSSTDVSNQLRERVLKTCLKTIRSTIPHEYKKVEQNNMIINSSEVKKVLFPTYLLTTTYKGKNYYYLMNGENGRAFAETCFGKFNIFIFGLFVFAILISLALLVVYFV